MKLLQMQGSPVTPDAAQENLKHSDFLNFAKDAPEYRELLDTLFVPRSKPKDQVWVCQA